MAEWLNQKYSGSVLSAAGEHFRRNGTLRLTDVLSVNALKSIQSNSWQKVLNPLKYSYGVSAAPNFVKSSEFKEFISKIIGSPMRLTALACAKFSQGDYSLLYDSLKPGKGVIFFIDTQTLSEDEGGYTVFVKGDDEVLRIIPEQNSLVLVRYDGLRFFTKYVNHRAKSDRVFLIGLALPK